MPRTARTAQTIGVIGIAEISEKNMNALLDDYLADKKAHFVIPVTNEHFSATVEMLTEYLVKEDIPFTAITDGKAGRGIKSYLADAAETTTATDVGVAIVNAVKAGENGVLFSLWDDTQDDDLDVAGALEFAEENKIPVLDFCDGLVPVKFVDDESDEPVAAAEDEPPFEPDPPKAPRAKAQKVADVIVDEDAPDDELSIPDYVVGKDLGVRKLKRIAKNMGLVNARSVGPLSREEVLDLLYPATAPYADRVGDLGADEEDEPFESDNVTTIVAKGAGGGAITGADSTVAITAGGGAITGYHVGYQDSSLRIKALEEATKVETRGTDVLATAKDFYAFLTGAA